MATDFVENVLKVHSKYREMILEVFQGDQAFMGAMDKAMTAVINFRQPKTQSKSPELVKKKGFHFPARFRVWSIGAPRRAKAPTSSPSARP